MNKEQLEKTEGYKYILTLSPEKRYTGIILSQKMIEIAYDVEVSFKPFSHLNRIPDEVPSMLVNNTNTNKNEIAIFFPKAKAANIT